MGTAIMAFQFQHKPTGSLARKSPRSGRPYTEQYYGGVPHLQCSLRLGPVDDPFEREADAVADAVVDGASGVNVAENAAVPRIQRACAECENDGEELLQRSAEPHGRSPALNANMRADISSLQRAPAKGLPERGYFESRFGSSFADVRVHHNTKSAGMANSLGASAFTVGRDIFFGAGQLDVSTARGRRLMAHELTHTLQQTGAGSTLVQRSLAAESSMDNTAEAVLEDVASGRLGMIGDVEDRVRALDAGELARLESELESSSFAGLDELLTEMLRGVILNVKTGAVGKSSVLPSSRPCEPGDYKPITDRAWTMNRAIADVVSGVGPTKLGRSSSPTAIQLVQQSLINWGCRLATPARNPLPTFGVDGNFGRETRKAVAQFQREEGLTADGDAGPMTLRALAWEVSHANLRDSLDQPETDTFESSSVGFEGGDTDGDTCDGEIEHVYEPGDGVTNRTTFVDVQILGHASPRWDYPKGELPKDLNYRLSHRRTEEIIDVLPGLLKQKLAGNLDITFSTCGQESDTPIGIQAGSRGSEDTLQEAGGNLHANDPELRRADIDLEFIDTVVHHSGTSEVGDSFEWPSECDVWRSQDWSIAVAGAAGGGEGMTVETMTGSLKNRANGGVRGWWLAAAGPGVGLPGNLTASSPSWTDFRTVQPMTFHDFNGVDVNVITDAFGIVFGWGVVRLFFQTFNTIPYPIKSEGWIFGLDWGASGMAGVFGIQGDTRACDPSHEIEESGMTTPATSGFVEGSSFFHRALFETGQAKLTPEEHLRLSGTLSAMVLEHQLLAEHDNE